MSEIILSGSYFEMGDQHGLLLRREIVKFLNDGLFQINKISTKKISVSNLEEKVGPYKEVIKYHLPEIFEEICGLAKGAGITICEAVLLQIRREIIGTNSFTLTGDCSSFGIYNAENIVSGQTIDLNGDMTDLGHVFRLIPSQEKGLEILQYSFSGLLGYMGMNNFGVSVTINLVVSDGWRVGIPPYLLVRKLLECRTIDECLEIARVLPIASSRSFIIQDRQKQIILEISPFDFRVLESKLLVHTNHYLHEDFYSGDRLNIFSRNSSIKRLNILKSSLCDHSTLDDIKLLFKDHSVFPVSICTHNLGNFEINETVASVIMYPQKLHFYAQKGKPCESSNYHLYKL